MTEIVSLLKNVTDFSDGNGELRNLLTSCKEQMAFARDPSNIPSIVGLINVKLNEPPGRYDGMLLLQSFLPQCSQEVLAVNASSWMLSCLKGTSGQHSCPLAFEVLKMLFKYVSELPEMTKVVSATIVPNLAEQIVLNVPTQGLHLALECLEECFDKYNGPCGPHKRVWERFLIPLVDYSGPQANAVIHQAARCFALLPQIGGGGAGGTMYSCAWSDQQKVICCTIHMVLEELLTDVNEVQIFQTGDLLEDCQPLPLPAVETSNPIHRVQLLTARLNGLISYLRSMLLVRFPVPKKIAISTIFNLICRGLALNNTSFTYSATTHSLALMAVLPKVQCILMNLLSSVIVVCRSNLLPFGALICKLALQILKWTHVKKWPHGTEKPYRTLRIQAYRLIVHWCGVAKCGSLIQDVADNLTEMAITDFFSEKDGVTLSSDLSRRNKYAQRKQSKQKAAPSNSKASGLEQYPPAVSVCISANMHVCAAALQAMRAMLASASSVVSPNIHKMLQEAVVSALLDVTRTSSTPLIPFSSNSARLELYQLLLALVLNPHSLWPSPYSVALKSFSCGLNDKDFQVSMFCTSALSCIEKIIHPAHSALHFQVPLDDVLGIFQSSSKPDTNIDTSTDVSRQHKAHQGDILHEKSTAADLSKTLTSSKQASSTPRGPRGSNTIPMEEKASRGTSLSPPSINLGSSEDEEMPEEQSLAAVQSVRKGSSLKESSKVVNSLKVKGSGTNWVSPTSVKQNRPNPVLDVSETKLKSCTGSVVLSPTLAEKKRYNLISRKDSESSGKSLTLEGMLVSSPDKESTRIHATIISQDSEDTVILPAKSSEKDALEVSFDQSFTVESDDDGNLSVQSGDSHDSVILDDDSDEVVSIPKIVSTSCSLAELGMNGVSPPKQTLNLEKKYGASLQIEDKSGHFYNEEQTGDPVPTFGISSAASTPEKKNTTAEEGEISTENKDGNESVPKKLKLDNEAVDNINEMLLSFVDKPQSLG